MGTLLLLAALSATASLPAAGPKPTRADIHELDLTAIGNGGRRRRGDA